MILLWTYSYGGFIIGIILLRSFIRLLTETGECGGWRYPQFLAPDGAASLEAIAIGLLVETFSGLIISLLQFTLYCKTDFSRCRIAPPKGLRAGRSVVVQAQHAAPSGAR